MTNLIAIIILFLFPIENHGIKYRLPDGYKPKELTTLTKNASFLDTTQRVDYRISDKLEGLIWDAQKQGICLVVSSGYRSYEYQQKVYDQAKDKTLVALPGKSEHQTGLAVDFQACPMYSIEYWDKTVGYFRDDTIERLDLKNSFETLPEYKWLQNNAKKYEITQTYSYESWHWKFNINK